VSATPSEEAYNLANAIRELLDNGGYAITEDDAARRIDALVARKVEEERERGEQDRRDFAEVLRCYWSFDNGQQHTHSWHDREDFIRGRLPAMLAAIRTTPTKG
jgi:hypothetical protein